MTAMASNQNQRRLQIILLCDRGSVCEQLAQGRCRQRSG